MGQHLGCGRDSSQTRTGGVDSIEDNMYYMSISWT